MRLCPDYNCVLNDAKTIYLNLRYYSHIASDTKTQVRDKLSSFNIWTTTHFTTFRMEASTAQKNWELENNIQTVDPANDKIYFYDAAQDKEVVAQKPWKNE